jgi:hypothetical protein
MPIKKPFNALEIEIRKLPNRAGFARKASIPEDRRAGETEGAASRVWGRSCDAFVGF